MLVIGQVQYRIGLIVGRLIIEHVFRTLIVILEVLVELVFRLHFDAMPAIVRAFVEQSLELIVELFIRTPIIDHSLELIVELYNIVSVSAHVP